MWTPPTLNTSRLILRDITTNDASSIFEYAKKPIVSKYTLWEPHLCLEDTKEYIEKYVFEYYKKQVPEPFAICLKDSPDILIGTVGAFWVSEKNQEMEIAYALNPDCWGKGYVVEACKELIKYIFENYQVNRIQCRCKKENIASERIMQKLAMHYEGILAEKTYHRARFWDMKYYALTRSMFNS